MKLIPADAMRRMPWKNGGGVTTEIAIAPAGATLDHFDWRVSTAQVDAAGPFSRFAGIDRSLAVIAGGRLTMHRADAEAVTLAPGEAPAGFPGEAAVHATLDAPLSDFNV
ncbi:HutD family protein, partial [Escherichia coli]|nr:HutD family protein [Escherichia coli]